MELKLTDITSSNRDNGMEHTIQNSQNFTRVLQAIKGTQKVREGLEGRTFSEVLAKNLQSC